MAMMRLVLNSVTKVVADLSRNLDLNWVAFFPWYLDTDLSGDLVRALHWLLVALHVLLGMALRSRGVSISGLSFSLCFTLFVAISTISTMSMGNNLRVMTNNSRAMVDLCVSSVALGGEGFLTLLNIGCVNNSFADWAGDFARVLDWLLVALSVLLVLALRSGGVTGLSISSTLAIPIAGMSMRDNL